MSIDKFGRSLKSSRKRCARGPPGIGFHLTEDGDYDIQNKRLVKIADPVDDTDGVNLKTMKLDGAKYIALNDKDCFVARQKRISDVSTPTDPNDVVIKKYLDERVPIRSDSRKAYSFHQYRLQDVAVPEVGGDAVNLSYFISKAVTKDKNGHYDLKQKQLHNLGVTHMRRDAATKEYVDDITDTHRVTINDLKTRMLKCEGLIASNKLEHEKDVRKLAVLIYNFVNDKHEGRAATLPENVAESDTLNWPQLFSLSRQDP